MMKDKFYGSIYGALIGDAMGAPTEMRTREQIIEFFGGYVRDFVSPPDDVFAKGRLPGQVTDDFSLAYYLIKELVESGGIIDEDLGKRSVINWSGDEEFCPRFAGPTTMAAINKLKAGEVFDPALEFGLVNYNNLLTNGAAMKIFPMGLLGGDDHDKTIANVITVAKPTHFTNLALSGACAIACAVGEALNPKGTLETINQAGIYGAKKGNIEAKKITGKISAGPSIEKRIELAIEIAKNVKGFDAVLIELSDIIGTGVWVTESVPCVFGLINAFPSTMEAIYAGVNIGSDTDTIATMAGAILGAFQGTKSLDEDLVKQALAVNGLKIDHYTEKLLELV